MVALHLFVRPVRNPTETRHHAGAGNLAARDALLSGDEGFRLARQVRHGGYPAHEELPRRGLHDFRIAGAVGAVPVLVVRVAENIHVHVHVDESRHDGHSGGVEEPGAVGDLERIPASDGNDAITVHENDRSGQWRSLVSVDQHATHDGERRALRLRILFAVEWLRRRYCGAGERRENDTRYQRGAPAATC